jgi:YbgC/YbaW family acyl-CoA thioester hydrolase
MTIPFRTTRRVEFADTDMAGIAHFANFFRFMEAAEVDFLHALGLSVRLEWQEQRLGFPRVAASCDYLRPVTFEDILEIEVRVDKIGRKSVSFAFDFLCRGEVAARGRVTSVCCKVGPEHRLEPIEIPAALRERLRQGPQPAAGVDEGL